MPVNPLRSISKYRQNTASLFGCYFSAEFNGILITLRIYRHEEQSTTTASLNGIRISTTNCDRGTVPVTPRGCNREIAASLTVRSQTLFALLSRFFGTERHFQKNIVPGRANWQLGLFELHLRRPRIRYRSLILAHSRPSKSKSGLSLSKETLNS